MEDRIKSFDELEDALNDLRCDMIDTIMYHSNKYEYDWLYERETDEIYDILSEVCN